ncbi:hypothetical protein HPP92_021787 [Vanilla planifolia]|uniref:transketolase n=1 Tax=Vanilla planifolia TaxID=51239 RepID=A0A835PS72_VANPL|nr:hypothetical protein HPP92_022100 [Vanilla planifolia]KAG0458659.1 hypothetical protein HPP92_021787 [Vanilla planifolia]
MHPRFYWSCEDGPTHQPIEHLMSFRAMPNILVLRPADGNETAGVQKGGYIVSDNSSGNNPDIILISSGSELEIAIKAAEELRKEGKAVRVVSLVSWELFNEQSDEYKESVFPAAVTARVSVEAGSTLGWEKFIGSKGKAIGIDRFGASAPAGRIYKEFGLTPENVFAVAKTII